MESNIQQAKKYSAAAGLIDDLMQKLAEDLGFTNANNGERVFLKSVCTLQEIATDIAIGYEDKATENI